MSNKDKQTAPEPTDPAPRSLGFFLGNTRRGTEDDPLDCPFLPTSDLDPGMALDQACDLLRCAAATAYETADQMRGNRRDLALSTVHLLQLARRLVEHSRDQSGQS